MTSLSTSLASSTISMSAYASSFYDDSTEPHAAPFQDHLAVADEDSVIGGGAIALAVPKHTRRARSRDVLLPRVASRRHAGPDLGAGIYLTVVKETV